MPCLEEMSSVMFCLWELGKTWNIHKIVQERDVFCGEQFSLAVQHQTSEGKEQLKETLKFVKFIVFSFFQYQFK